ncbi:MAG: hypothetical protein H0T48_04415 [Gemmatimonadaceae bacterium]|nr:hypothetical protein [Gemmatimonadaceae bacterium]
MGYVLLYLPFGVAWLLQDSPTASYAVAWTGSLFIIWATVSGRVRRLPPDRSLSLQLFRPIVFTQIVFAGYNALSSIFYFVSLRQEELALTAGEWASPALAVTAEAQSYYVLAHAGVVTGILLLMDYRDSGRFRLVGRLGANRMLITIAVVFFVVTLGLSFIPGMKQVTFRTLNIAVVASVLSFALSLIHREGTLIVLNAALFAANFAAAVLRGWKEDVLVLLLLFFAALFPYYRRATVTVGSVALLLFVLIMPAYTKVYRSLAWYGEATPAAAAKIAYDQVISGKMDLGLATEEFLEGRLSEIGMFVRYINQVPENRPFYGSQLVVQAASNLVPRIVWQDKPNTEIVVMERVYENDIFSRLAIISAKPQYVVDGYLSAGILGVLFASIFYGLLVSLMSRLAERWFGGYTFGSGLVYAALFPIFWRGNAFEFFFGTVFWSFVLMVVLFQAGRRFHFLVPAARPLRRGVVPAWSGARGSSWPQPVSPILPGGQSQGQH